MPTLSLTYAQQRNLAALAGLPMERALRGAVSFLSRLSNDRAFVDALVLPLLREAREAEDWYVAYDRDGPDESYSLQLFYWPPRSRTQIHDHTSWGVYRCVIGSVLEERYERLDEGLRPDHARLRKVWQLRWSREDGASTVLPHEEGIHRVTNTAESPAISVHLYGPPMGEVDGRDYDPSRNYVCDRPVA